jgi:hypothetical protein
MTNEQLRMQMLSGIITESEYKAKLEEGKFSLMKNTSKEARASDIDQSDTEYIITRQKRDKVAKEMFGKTYKECDSRQRDKVRSQLEKESLNENFVGMGMVGNIFDREKTDYEMAFEHFLGERYLTNFENREQDPYKMEEGKEKIDEMDEDDELEDLIDWAQTKLWGDFDYDEYEVKKMSPQKLYYELENLIYSYDPDYTKFKKFESMVNEEVKKEVKENATPNLYMDLKNTLFPYYTDLTGEERVTMIDKIIKELNAYISILQNEKNTK